MEGEGECEMRLDRSDRLGEEVPDSLRLDPSVSVSRSSDDERVRASSSGRGRDNLRFTLKSRLEEGYRIGSEPSQRLDPSMSVSRARLGERVRLIGGECD